MKHKIKFLFLGATAMFAASCSSDIDNFKETPTTGRPVVLRASIEQPDTRAAIMEQGKINWQAGDNISVRLSDLTNLEMTVTETSAGTANATFEGLIMSEAELIAPTVAVYPAGLHNLKGENPVVNMPATYTVADNENTNMPMVCNFNAEGVGTFKHVGGVIRFKLGTDYLPSTATKFRFTTMDNQNITGDFAVSDDVISATAGDGSRSSVTVVFNRDQIVDKVLYVNIPVPVGTYTGIRIDILDDADRNVFSTIEAKEAINKVERGKRIVMQKITPVTLTAGTESLAISTDAELSSALRDANPNINLSAGDYSKVILPVPNVNPKSGTGTTDDPYHITRVINSMSIDGVSQAKLAGFEIFCGRNVVYKNPSGNYDSPSFNEDLAVAAHPSYYYITKDIEIGTLTIKNITMTGAFDLHDTGGDSGGNIKADNIIFENVTFDMSGAPADCAVAARVINKDADVKNITFKNCHFINCSNISKPIAFDARTTDDVNITVDGCTFDSAEHNAMQFGGKGSNFTGKITIKNNTINNTGDRGIRISTASGYLTITNNTLVNAADDDNEAMKWDGTPSTIVFERNTLNDQPLSLITSGSSTVAKVAQ